MKPVRSLDEFKELKIQGTGFFIITENTNPTKIHDVNCSFVSVDNFQIQKNGRFSWVSFSDGRSREITPCQKCMK